MVVVWAELNCMQSSWQTSVHDSQQFLKLICAAPVTHSRQQWRHQGVHPWDMMLGQGDNQCRGIQCGKLLSQGPLKTHCKHTHLECSQILWHYEGVALSPLYTVVGNMQAEIVKNGTKSAQASTAVQLPVLSTALPWQQQTFLISSKLLIQLLVMLIYPMKSVNALSVTKDSYTPCCTKSVHTQAHSVVIHSFSSK